MFTGGQNNHCAWPFGWQDHRQGHILDNVLLLNPLAPQWVYSILDSCQVQREQPSKRWPQTRVHRSTWILSRSQAADVWMQSSILVRFLLVRFGSGTQITFTSSRSRRWKGSGHYNSGSCYQRTCQGEKCNANPISSRWQTCAC